MNSDGKFSHTPYNFEMLIEICKKLTKQVVLSRGGRIETDVKGNKVLVIPVEKPKHSKFVQSWNPEPIANGRFTPAELAKIEIE